MGIESTQIAIETFSASTLVLAILSSTVFGAIIASLVNGYFSLQIKNREHENLFFQKVIHKRLEAYEFIERQISILKLASQDTEEDNKYCHMVFSFSEKDFYDFQKNLSMAMTKSIWITKKTNGFLIDLNQIFFKISNTYDLSNELELEKAGKDSYQDIANIRDQLESSVAHDFIELYEIKKFLSKKL